MALDSTLVSMPAMRARSSAKAARRFETTSFLLYYYDTDETADSPYYDSAEKYSFAGNNGNYQLPYLKSFRKTK